MFFDKNKKIKKRLELEKSNENLLIYDFILKMQEHNIYLKKVRDGELTCLDLHLHHEYENINYFIKKGKLFIDFNENINYLIKAFYPYYKISYDFNQEHNGLNTIENLYINLIKGLDLDNKEYGEILRASFSRLIEDDEIEFEEYKGFKEWKIGDFFRTRFFPSLSFNGEQINKRLILCYRLKDSPYDKLYGSCKDIIINIKETPKTYEIKIFYNTYALEIDELSISKEYGLELITKKMLIAIKGLSINKETFDLLGIKNWKELTEDHYETLKLLRY